MEIVRLRHTVMHQALLTFNEEMAEKIQGHIHLYYLTMKEVVKRLRID